MLDLTDYLDRKPRQLSGGQRQRVAMGRAIVREPRVFLMDEPLSNLDAQLRVATRAEIAALQQRLAITTVYVTHDQVEAMTMGDRVAVMKDGVLQQCDTPRVLYDSPVNAFVAGFIGSPPMNLIRAHMTDAGVRIGAAVLPCPATLPVQTGDDVVVGLRPEAIRLGEDDGGLKASVTVVEELGSEALVHASLAGEDELPSATQIVIVRVNWRLAPTKGEPISLHPEPSSMLFFDAASGSRIEAGASETIAYQ
jgi:multiple sugar transport system ATP-binding protein